MYRVFRMFKVTVIMPVYNDEKYVAEAIESVLDQTLDGIELICINDGSTDNTPEILDEFSKKYECIKIMHQENSGASVCRNRAMLQASGEFITFLDSDDYYADKTALEKMYDVAVKNNANMVSANIKSFTVKGKLITNDNLEEFDEYKSISPEDYGIPYTFGKNLYRRSFMIENKFMFPEYSRGEDPVFLANVLGHVDKIYCVPVILMGIRAAKYHGLLKIDTPEKKLGYIKHFKDTFDILEENKFYDMRDRYKEKLFDYIKFGRNFADNDIYNMVQKVFKKDKATLKQCNKLFKFTNPKISIIIPFDNKESHLNKLIDNLLRLNFRNEEYIFISNKPEEEQIPVLEDFKQKDSRVKIIFNNHFNNEDILNIASKYANGDYVFFMNPGDSIAEKTFNKLYKQANKKKADVVFFKTQLKQDFNIIYELGNSLKNVNRVFDYKSIREHIFDSSFIPWGKMYSRYFLSSLDNSYYEDENSFNFILFHIQCILSAKRMCFVDEVLYYQNDKINNEKSYPADLEDIFKIFDSIEKFLKDAKLYKKFHEDFNLFKINSIIGFNVAEVSQSCYNLSRRELLKTPLDEAKINNYYLEQYKFIVTHDSYEEYLSVADEFRIYKAQYEFDKLIEKENELVDANKVLKNKLNKSKKLNDELFSSSSWKLTKPLRGLR